MGISLLCADRALAQQYTITDLGNLDGQGPTFAYGINASGQVVGTTWTSVGQHAFLWTAGTMQDLGLLPGAFECLANAINDNGQVVGFCNTGFHQTAAFVWAADTGMAELPFPNQSVPLGINNAGHIVGYFGASGPTIHAFVYRDGTFEDLGLGTATGNQ